MLCLQNRWKLENKYLVYYGIRKKPYLLKNKIKVSKKQLTIINKLPKKLNDKELLLVKGLINQGIIVEESKLKKTPRSYEEAQFCNECVANDFIIPGLEFDENGICPMCANKDEAKKLKSVLPTINDIPYNKKGRFDIALFYTGGKDSTYLLYYLSKVLKLRVLALTWEIPFMSESAKVSIENAKNMFSNVEFISRRVSNKDLIKMYSKLYELNGNTCACPTLAYVLFFPDLVLNKVPYFVAGNEPVQIIGFYYNNIAPKITFTFHDNKFLNFLINVGRVLTLHPPLKKGQFHTLMTMNELARGNKLTKFLKYRNTILENVRLSINEIEHIRKPLKKFIRKSSWTGNIPAFINIDLNKIAGGVYDWKKIKDILVKEAGWVAPKEEVKGLHTSCSIEKCKEYSQFIKFYQMESTIIPFSALELALASRNKNVSKEEALKEMKECMGFSLEEISECQIMKDYLNSLNNND